MLHAEDAIPCHSSQHVLNSLLYSYPDSTVVQQTMDRPIYKVTLQSNHKTAVKITNSINNLFNDHAFKNAMKHSPHVVLRFCP